MLRLSFSQGLQENDRLMKLVGQITEEVTTTEGFDDLYN